MQNEEHQTADNYEDIIGLEHPTSKRHPRMPMANRAAQFAPFAALPQFGESIRDKALHAEENTPSDYEDL